MLAPLIARLLSRLPSQCAVCRAWPSQTLCEDCVLQLAAPRPRCQTCAIALPAGARRCGACILDPPALDSCFAAVSYGFPWSRCLHEFKFGQQPGWARPLARLMQQDPAWEALSERVDLLLPMPLSAQRLCERGYNQAAELARQLSPERCHGTLLLRLRDTPAQSTLPRSGRLRNLRGALAVDPLQAPSLRHRRVLLIDDVMTTGASLEAAALALRAAGAREVHGAVLARTENAVG